MKKEELLIKSNGQWELNKSDEYDKAYSQYKAPTKSKTYDTKDYVSKEGEMDHLSGMGNNNVFNDYSSKLPKWKRSDRKLLDSKDWDSGLAHDKFKNLQTKNGYGSFYSQPHVNGTGYDAGEDTHSIDDVTGRSIYSVFHHDSENKKLTHVGDYDIDPDDHMVGGETHKDHEHMHKPITDAVSLMHRHNEAIKDHEESYRDQNPHLSQYSFSDPDNYEHGTMYEDSFKHFLKHGKAIHFDKKTHDKYRE